MSAHDAEDRLRELMRATTLDPPLRPDLPERVRAGARRRRRLQQGGAALCVVLAAVSGAVIARTWDARTAGSHAVSGSVSCAGTVVTALAGSQRAVLPGRGADELTVRLGDTVRFQAVGPCAAHVGLVSNVENLVGRTTSFPNTGEFVADAAKLGTETAEVTVTNCPGESGSAGCGNPMVVGVLTVRIVDQPTP